MKKQGYIFLFLLIYFNSTFGQDNWPSGNLIIPIDSIKISKNWRTKDMIILNELGFDQGKEINQNTLDKGITRIWNIGNFSDVKYMIDTLEGDRILLNITAKDAITIVPILSFSGNQEDFRYTLGVSDNNFLGKNLKIGLVGSYGSNVTDFGINFTIPRQLLYKNMALHTKVVYGHNEQYRYDGGVKTTGVGYEKKVFSMSISNPWHEDFKYTFSPNFGLTYFQHSTDSIYNQPEIKDGNYTINYLSAYLSESIGYMKRKRHQKDGYLIIGSVGSGIGLDSSSPHYISLGLTAIYNKLFNQIIQFSAKFSTAYTSSDVPSLLFYKGNQNVKGSLYGEISGKAFYTAYIAGHFTYLNRNWIALEQSLFVNWGNGKDTYKDIYTTTPIASVGSGLSIMVPMIPWLYIRFFYTLTNGQNDGFSIEF